LETLQRKFVRINAQVGKIAKRFQGVEMFSYIFTEIIPKILYIYVDRKGKVRAKTSKVIYNRCKDCGRERPEFYMVENRVWYGEAKARHNDILCLDCLERKIGRSLDISDFKEIPVNELLFVGYRMRGRESNEENIR
jgi:hypothetical protein